MQTQTFSLTANTPDSVIQGNIKVLQVIYTVAAAGALKIYDSADDDVTQSDPAYLHNTRTNPYTRTDTARDLRDQIQTYNYEGISTAEVTVSADPTADLAQRAALSTPAAGQAQLDESFQVVRGLLLSSTVNATVEVTWEDAV